MEAQRERARRGAGAVAPDTHEAVIEFVERGARDAVRRLRATPGRDQRRRLADAGRERGGAGEARGEPVLPRGRRPGLRLGRPRLGGRRGLGRRRLPRRARTRRVRARGADARGRDAGRGQGRPRRAARDDAKPHSDAPAARGASRAARHPRPPGGLGGAPGQAPLRLHPRAAASPGRAPRDRGRRERVDQGEPRGARAGDVARRGARRSGRWRCSARSTATGCGWSRSTRSRASSAAGPTSRRRAECGIFAIVSEGSSAANVRRIEALTGPAAIDWFRERSASARPRGQAARQARGPGCGGRARRGAPREARAPGRRGRARGGGRGGRAARRPRPRRSAASSWSRRGAR